MCIVSPQDYVLYVHTHFMGVNVLPAMMIILYLYNTHSRTL